MTFLHQRVYDADSACLVPLTPIPEGTDQGLLSCIGADIDPTLAKEIALGEVDPISKKRFEDQEFVSVKASRTPQEKPARLPPFNPRLAQPRRPLSETLEATNSTAKVLDKCEKVKNSQVKQKISASAISRTPSAFRFKSLLKTRNSVVVKKVTSSVSHYFNALTTSSTSTDTVVNADAGGQDGYALSSKKKIRLDQIFK